MTSTPYTQSFECLNGLNSSATMQLLREAAAWARREGLDEFASVGFGRWYVRNTDGSTPLATALLAFGGTPVTAADAKTQAAFRAAGVKL